MKELIKVLLIEPGKFQVYCVGENEDLLAALVSVTEELFRAWYKKGLLGKGFVWYFQDVLEKFVEKLQREEEGAE